MIEASEIYAMPISDREFEMLQKGINDKLRTILNEIKEIKATCCRRIDNCAIIFEKLDARIKKNSDDVLKIKTVGGVIGFLWGLVMAALSSLFGRKL